MFRYSPAASNGGPRNDEPPVEAEHMAELSLAELCRGLRYRVEHRLDVGGERLITPSTSLVAV